MVPPVWVEISRDATLVSLDTPPKVPSLKPIALKLVFAFVPPATVNAELADNLTVAMYVSAVVVLNAAVDMPEMPIAAPVPVLVPTEIFLPSEAVRVTPLPLLVAVTPV